MFGNNYNMGGYPSYPYYPMNGAMPDALGQLRNQQMQLPTQPNQAPQQAESNVNWVQGIEGAKSWYVPAGKNVILMDSENQVFYIKSVDASGMPLPLRIFEYKEITQQPASAIPAQPEKIDLGKFVTRDELNEILAKALDGKKDGEKDG